MNIITRQGRPLLLSAVLAVGSVLVLGCGGGDDGGTNTPVTPSGTNPGTTPGGNNSGGSYESVSLGGKKWMKKNLNVETADSWCYGNSPDSCAKYGRLYTWSAAKMACPSGWRLPDTSDWRRLVEAAGGQSTAGSKLKSTSGWYNNGNGTDAYGFSALPGGRRDAGGTFRYVGSVGYWWAATESGSSSAYYRYMTYLNDSVGEYTNDRRDGFSVRCVQD